MADDNALRASGDDEFFADQFSDLLRSQHAALLRILVGVQDVAKKETLRGARFERDPQAYAADQWRRRPHNVFFIDGARGSGKTYLLLTAQHFIGLLGRQPGSPLDSGQDGERVNRSLESLRQMRGDFSARDLDPFALPKPNGAARFDRSALVLPVVFPADLEGEASSMEAICAGLNELLKQATSVSSRSADAARETYEELRSELSQGVARRWLFSRNLGVEAILNDSLDFKDFVVKRSAEAWDANLRIDEWRGFVNRFLDAFGAAVLVVFLDDTDVLPELTVDILHTIRMFLSHPRIVTVIAGNSKAMRQNLVYGSMDRLAQPMRALNRDDHPTGSAWRRLEREEIEQYLEKVLPRWGRVYLRARARAPDCVGEAASGANPPRHSDFKRIVGEDFDEFCRHMLESKRTAFFGVKGKVALRYETSGHDRTSPVERAVLEDFIAWWRLRHAYANSLAPRSARQMLAFQKYFHEAPRGTQTNPKRLAVTLFESPENYALAQRFTDTDPSVLEWLRHQDIASRWVGRRTFELNGHKLHEGTYSYDFLCYRLDLGIAMPLRINEDAVAPLELLPRPLGVPFVGAFFQLAPGQGPSNRFGVARSIRHAAIPGNCIYMSDLRSLPDTAFEEGLTSAKIPEARVIARAAEREPELRSNQLGWESGLFQNWPHIFADDLTTSAPMRYLATWVFPTLSNARLQEAVASLADPIREPFLIREVRAWARYAATRGGGGVQNSYVAFRRLYGDNSTSGSPSEPILRDTRGAYLGLVNDLRRAWHAARIFATSLHETDRGDGGDDPEMESLEVRATNDIYAARDRYRVLGMGTMQSIICTIPWLESQLQWRWATTQAKLGASKLTDDDLAGLRGIVARTPDTFAQEFGRWRDYWKKRSQGPIGERDSVFIPLFAEISGPNKDPRIPLEARKARIARHLLLFLYGLESTIPALVHCDVAAMLFQSISNRTHTVESAMDLTLEEVIADHPDQADLAQIIRQWEWFVAAASSFTRRLKEDAKDMMFYARVNAEGAKAEHSEKQTWFESRWSGDHAIYERVRKSAKTDRLDVAFTFAPDFTQFTLLGEPRGTRLPFGLELQPGIFPEIERHLFVAWCYIQLLRDCLPPAHDEPKAEEAKAPSATARKTRARKTPARKRADD